MRISVLFEAVELPSIHGLDFTSFDGFKASLRRVPKERLLMRHRVRLVEKGYRSPLVKQGILPWIVSKVRAIRTTNRDGQWYAVLN